MILLNLISSSCVLDVYKGIHKYLTDLITKEEIQGYECNYSLFIDYAQYVYKKEVMNTNLKKWNYNNYDVLFVQDNSMFIESGQGNVSSLVGAEYLVGQRNNKIEELADSMSKNYGVSVLPINCDQLKKEDINHILEQVLLEFPIKEIDFCAPKWVEILSSEHWLKKSLCTTALDILDSFTYMKDTRESMNDITELKEAIDSVNLSSVNLANGKVEVTFVMSPGVYYDILSELTNTEIHNEYELISIIRSLSEKKNEFDSVKDLAW